ncbi:hypothetical protein L484_008220 [Morus notabilis]|uniref:Uncharacterized protein n=1 Tax=Morus notabilis TaxID=981085 RepID=W9SJZ2_9ROSA|nr:hypothetical protein L484_008220 [Morus notabilis]
MLMMDVETVILNCDALLNSKVEAYFESLLEDVKEENEREISIAVEKALAMRLQKMHAKLECLLLVIFKSVCLVSVEKHSRIIF